MKLGDALNLRNGWYEFSGKFFIFFFLLHFVLFCFILFFFEEKLQKRRKSPSDGDRGYLCNVSVERTNAMKYLPRYFEKGQV